MWRINSAGWGFACVTMACTKLRGPNSATAVVDPDLDVICLCSSFKSSVPEPLDHIVLSAVVAVVVRAWRLDFHGGWSPTRNGGCDAAAEGDGQQCDLLWQAWGR